MNLDDFVTTKVEVEGEIPDLDDLTDEEKKRLTDAYLEATIVGEEKDDEDDTVSDKDDYDAWSDLMHALSLFEKVQEFFKVLDKSDMKDYLLTYRVNEYLDIKEEIEEFVKQWDPTETSEV